MGGHAFFRSTTRQTDRVSATRITTLNAALVERRGCSGNSSDGICFCGERGFGSTRTGRATLTVAACDTRLQPGSAHQLSIFCVRSSRRRSFWCYWFDQHFADVLSSLQRRLMRCRTWICHVRPLCVNMSLLASTTMITSPHFSHLCSMSVLSFFPMFLSFVMSICCHLCIRRFVAPHQSIAD